jgi:predicted CXXCH cytochrome family protein
VLESCANCHSPHGSNHENMLVLPKPRLCQTCHIESRHPTQPHTTPPVPGEFIAFRGCVTCHYNIHGSNHPSGYRFTR